MDNEHQVAIAVGGGDYFEVPGTQPHVVFQPIKTNESIKLEEGIEVTDPHRQAYLLYEHQGGLKVYDLDALDTKINECALLIPKEEARKKREEIILGSLFKECDSLAAMIARCGRRAQIDAGQRVRRV